jgi:hypothetical protein
MVWHYIDQGLKNSQLVMNSQKLGQRDVKAVSNYRDWINIKDNQLSINVSGLVIQDAKCLDSNPCFFLRPLQNAPLIFRADISSCSVSNFVEIKDITRCVQWTVDAIRLTSNPEQEKLKIPFRQEQLEHLISLHK